MQFDPPPGFVSDSPWATPVSRAVWVAGYNVRFRLNHLETIGLFGALKTVAGANIKIPLDGAVPVRTLHTAPFDSGVQIVASAVNRVHVVSADQGSTPVTGTRYFLSEITPAGLTQYTDTIPDPDLGVVHIAHDWFWLVDGDVIVGTRADTAESPWSWDRNVASTLQTITDAPFRAVGGAIVDGILVLLGCDSVDPAVSNKMTIRWSDRFDFNEWIPGELNISGERQASKGSRIMGGGNTTHGVITWTDVAMYSLQSTGEITEVFTLDEVTTSHGLLANHAWCEIEGVVYFLDQSRKLCRYSGGRVDVIINPLKLVSLERLDSSGLPRIYLQPNVEYTEILSWFPASDNDTPNRTLVYDYGSTSQGQGWSLWALARTGWFPRVGAQDVVGVDPGGTVYAQDLDVSLDTDLLVPPTVQNAPDAADVEAFDWEARSNLITSDSPSYSTHGFNRVAFSSLVSHADGAETDVLTLTVRSYENLKPQDQYMEESYSLTSDISRQDIRTEGRSLQIGFSGTAVKTVTRIGMIDLGAGESIRGER